MVTLYNKSPFVTLTQTDKSCRIEVLFLDKCVNFNIYWYVFLHFEVAFVNINELWTNFNDQYIFNINIFIHLQSIVYFFYSRALFIYYLFILIHY